MSLVKATIGVVGIATAVKSCMWRHKLLKELSELKKPLNTSRNYWNMRYKHMKTGAKFVKNKNGTP